MKESVLFFLLAVGGVLLGASSIIQSIEIHTLKGQLREMEVSSVVEYGYDCYISTTNSTDIEFPIRYGGFWHILITGGSIVCNPNTATSTEIEI